MNDNSANTPPITIYGLMQQLSFLLDKRYTELRKTTPYGSVRPSDVRMFVQIARRARGETEIAHAMNISRQAVQNSVKRLVALKLVEVVPMPGNGRNKIVQITALGAQVRDTAAEHIRIVEAECAEIIGVGEMERLHGLLLHLSTGYRDKLAAKKGQATGV